MSKNTSGKYDYLTIVRQGDMSAVIVIRGVALILTRKVKKIGFVCRPEHPEDGRPSGNLATPKGAPAKDSQGPYV